MRGMMVLAAPDTRVIHAVLAFSAAIIAATATAFALDFVGAADGVTMAVAIVCAGLATLSRAWRTSWLPVLVALGVAYGLAFALHDHAGRDASVAAAGAVLAGFLIRPISRAQVATEHEGALDRFECIALTAGRSLAVAGILGVMAHAPIVRVAGVLGLSLAVGLLAMAMWRDRVRARFLAQVYAKSDPTYRIERDDDVRGFELLPPVLSGTITNAVIARVSRPATYRTQGGPRPVARVTASLSKMLARLDKRARMAKALLGVLVCSSSLVVVAPFHRTTSLAHSRVPTSVMPRDAQAPACRDARAYFAETLETALVQSVGRTALLTHAQDPSISEGQGVILLVPKTKGVIDEATKARALTIADAVPCADRLTLVVEEPTYRPIAVDATLELEPGVDRATAFRDADEQVREIFEPDARVVYNEHVDFGYVEKTFGYRVRHALRHVLGVKSVQLTVNGVDADVPLAPRDFPTLGSLTLH
jgi:hypothetical protein